MCRQDTSIIVHKMLAGYVTETQCKVEVEEHKSLPTYAAIASKSYAPPSYAVRTAEGMHRRSESTPVAVEASTLSGMPAFKVQAPPLESNARAVQPAVEVHSARHASRSGTVDVADV